MQDQRIQFRTKQCNRTLDVLVQVKNWYCDMEFEKEKLFVEEAFSTEDSPAIAG